jgi:AdoMet-dependent heme synthase
MSCSLAGDLHHEQHCTRPNSTIPGQATNRDLESLEPHDFELRPSRVMWEMTRACDLSCVHCRADSRPKRHPLELSTAEAFHLIDQVAEMRVPLFVLTGGDPLKRPDLFPVVQYACRRGVRTSLTPSATPLLTRNAVFRLKGSGLIRLALSLDGSRAELHDEFRGVVGSYKQTVDAVAWCHEAELPVQVNTTVSRFNIADLDKMIELLISLPVALWSVFFLVPTGRAQLDQMLSPNEHEQVFAKLYAASKTVKFHIKTNEGQHYLRYVLQQKAREPRATTQEELTRRASLAVDDGKGFVFVSHTGEVYPSGFLPLSAGNVLWEPLAEIYRNSPLLISLRDSSRLKGKCGGCEFKDLCGGSRARAYSVTGDPLNEEPCCAYIPSA